LIPLKILLATLAQAAMDAGFLITKAQVARVSERIHCDLAHDVPACVDPARKRQDADAAVNAIALPDGHFCWVALMAVVANVETLGALNRTITRTRSDEAKVAAVTQRDQRVRTWVMPDAETPRICRGLNPLFAEMHP
jgi:hypothetical protein